MRGAGRIPARRWSEPRGKGPRVELGLRSVFRAWLRGGGCLTPGGCRADGGRSVLAAGGGGAGSALAAGAPTPLLRVEEGLDDVDLAAGFRVAGAGDGGRAGEASRAGGAPGKRDPASTGSDPPPAPLAQAR